MVASTNWMKLLAAGCVVGLLSGVSVKAEADALEPAETVVEDEYEVPVEDGYDAYGDEVDVFAPAEAPAEAPVEEPAEAPVEEDEVEAPDSVDGEFPDADPDALLAMGYSVTQGIDYIPGPDKLATVGDISSAMAADAEECAANCDADPLCNLAAYFTVPPGNQDMNCFLKGIDPGCTLPTDIDEAENGWLLLSDTKCDVEVTATTVAAAGPAAVAAAPAAVAIAPAAVAAAAPASMPGDLPAGGVGTATATAAAPVGTEDTGTRAVGADDATSTEDDAVAPASSSAAGVCASVAVIAVAGAAALM